MRDKAPRFSISKWVECSALDRCVLSFFCFALTVKPGFTAKPECCESCTKPVKSEHMAEELDENEKETLQVELMESFNKL